MCVDFDYGRELSRARREQTILNRRYKREQETAYFPRFNTGIRTGFGNRPNVYGSVAGGHVSSVPPLAIMPDAGDPDMGQPVSTVATRAVFGPVTHGPPLPPLEEIDTSYSVRDAPPGYRPTVHSSGSRPLDEEYWEDL